MRNYFACLCIPAIAWIVAVPAYAQKRPAAPPPRHDISGAWLGPVDPRKEPAPPMAPWGQKFFDDAKPLQGPRALPIAKTNDPLVTCDPLGFPRASVYETRGFQFEQVP